jgi:hypothetical protein
MLENLLNPNKENSTPSFSKEDFEEYKSYTKQVGEAEKAAEGGGVTNLDEQKTPEFLFERKLIFRKISREIMYPYDIGRATVGMHIEPRSKTTDVVAFLRREFLTAVNESTYAGHNSSNAGFPSSSCSRTCTSARE